MKQNAQRTIDQSEWMARSNIDFWGRNPTILSLPFVIYISHDLAIRVLARQFEVITRDVHYINRGTRAILAGQLNGKLYQEDEITKAEKAIEKHIAEVEEWLDRRITQAVQRIEGEGFETKDALPEMVNGYKAKIVVPAARRFLDVIVKANNYLLYNDLLALAEGYSARSDEATRTRLNNEREVRNQLLSISRTTTSHFQTWRRICNEVLEQRRVAKHYEERNREDYKARLKARSEKKAAQTAAEKQARKEARDEREARRVLAEQRKKAQADMNRLAEPQKKKRRKKPKAAGPQPNADAATQPKKQAGKAAPDPAAPAVQPVAA